MLYLIIITVCIAILVPIWITNQNNLFARIKENNDCPIKIGDYYLQMDGGRGVPILRKRVESFEFDDLFKCFYYPYSGTDENFKKNVEEGHYIVISQKNVQEVYKKYTNKNIE